MLILYLVDLLPFLPKRVVKLQEHLHRFKKKGEQAEKNDRRQNQMTRTAAIMATGEISFIKTRERNKVGGKFF